MREIERETDKDIELSTNDHRERGCESESESEQMVIRIGSDKRKFIKSWSLAAS